MENCDDEEQCRNKVSPVGETRSVVKNSVLCREAFLVLVLFIFLHSLGYETSPVFCARCFSALTRAFRSASFFRIRAAPTAPVVSKPSEPPPPPPPLLEPDGLLEPEDEEEDDEDEGAEYGVPMTPS